MYPLASSAPDGRTPASPRFPEIERRILAVSYTHLTLPTILRV